MVVGIRNNAAGLCFLRHLQVPPLRIVNQSQYLPAVALHLILVDVGDRRKLSEIYFLVNLVFQFPSRDRTYLWEKICPYHVAPGQRTVGTEGPS